MCEAPDFQWVDLRVCGGHHGIWSQFILQEHFLIICKTAVAWSLPVSPSPRFLLHPHSL